MCIHIWCVNIWYIYIYTYVYIYIYICDVYIMKNLLNNPKLEFNGLSNSVVSIWSNIIVWYGVDVARLKTWKAGSKRTPNLISPCLNMKEAWLNYAHRVSAPLPPAPKQQHQHLRQDNAMPRIGTVSVQLIFGSAQFQANHRNKKHFRIAWPNFHFECFGHDSHRIVRVGPSKTGQLHKNALVQTACSYLSNKERLSPFSKSSNALWHVIPIMYNDVYCIIPRTKLCTYSI